MKIKKIKIDKFRKIENVEIDKFGIVNELFGSNGCGKTSFISFITWIIYGETLDFGTNDEMNIDTFNPNEYISGEITFDNDYKLARTYGIDDNGIVKNDFFCNDRKCKSQKEYYEYVNEIFGITGSIKIKGLNLIRALSDPYYLTSKPNEFRELISRLINIDTYSILFEDEKYQLIKDDYDKQKKDFDTCKDYYNSKINEIDNDVKKIKSIINDYKSSLVKIDNIDIDKIKDDRDNLEKELSSVISEINNEIISKQKELFSLQDKIKESQLNDKKNNELNTKLVLLKSEYNDLVDKLQNISLENGKKEIELKNLNSSLKEYEKYLSELKSMTFTEIHCPNCNTLINENDYKKFNVDKVKKINETNSEIEKTKKKIKEIKIIETTDLEKQIETKVEEIKTINSKILEVDNYKSEETIKLEQERDSINDEVMYLVSNKEKNIEEKTSSIKEKLKQIEDEIAFFDNNNTTLAKIKDYNVSLENALKQKSIFTNKLTMLKAFKNDEILLLKNNTSRIFGEVFDFEMLVKNKSNDNYKKVCYASIEGLEQTKQNTANYLYYSIVMLEKIKQYINPNCDIPIIFDIADNLGEKATKNITDVIKNSQIFYTRIEWKDNVERQLKIIK